jgi:hypothetical protein
VSNIGPATEGNESSSASKHAYVRFQGFWKNVNVMHLWSRKCERGNAGEVLRNEVITRRLVG